MFVSQESGAFGGGGGAAFSRAAGLTQTLPTQIRSPLQSVSLKQPWGAGGGARGGNSFPAGRGTHDGLSCWHAAALPVMHCAFRSFTFSQRAALLNPETAEATNVAASAVERSVAPALTPPSMQLSPRPALPQSGRLRITMLFTTKYVVPTTSQRRGDATRGALDGVVGNGHRFPRPVHEDERATRCERNDDGQMRRPEPCRHRSPPGFVRKPFVPPHSIAARNDDDDDASGAAVEFCTGELSRAATHTRPRIDADPRARTSRNRIAEWYRRRGNPPFRQR